MEATILIYLCHNDIPWEQGDGRETERRLQPSMLVCSTFFFQTDSNNSFKLRLLVVVVCTVKKGLSPYQFKFCFRFVDSSLE